MTQKNDIISGIVLGLSIIALIASIMSIYNNTQNTNIVGFRINIDKSNVEKGSELTLFYELKNYYNTDVSNINFIYFIDGITEPLVKTIDNIKPGESYRDTIKFQTSDLKKDKYIISTKIEYIYPLTKQNKPYGLTLGFEVY